MVKVSSNSRERLLPFPLSKGAGSILKKIGSVVIDAKLVGLAINFQYFSDCFEFTDSFLGLDSGKNVDKSHIIPPDKPRVNCSNFQCNSKSNFTHSPGLFGRSRNASLSTCSALNYSSPAFDLYRLFYGLFAPDFSESEAKFWPSLWPAETLNLYADKPETTFIDLARAFVALQLTEAGIDTTSLNVTAQLMQFYGLGPVTDEERCFVCCCNAIPKFANRNPRVCPLPRDRPNFCLKGQSVARQCISDVDCAPNNAAGMCGYDPEIVTCLEWDQGWICWDVYSRNKSAIRLDFVNPQKYRDLNTPAVSGKFITSGNLHEVTSLGYQVSLHFFSPSFPSRHYLAII